MPRPVKVIMENKPYDGHIHKLVKTYRRKIESERFCIRCGLRQTQIYFNEEDGDLQ